MAGQYCAAEEHPILPWYVWKPRDSGGLKGVDLVGPLPDVSKHE